MVRLFVLTAFAAAAALGEVIVLENTAARLGIETAGGAIVDFQLKALPLNPFTWEETGGAANRLRGHFICFDRWGAPSEAEKTNGMPFHGEAPRVAWQVTGKTANSASMHAHLPMANLEIHRTVNLQGAIVSVTETVKNIGPLGRVYNLVQHPSIAPPFLDETTVVDSNARKGFSQSSPMPNPEEPSFVWPQAVEGARTVDIRHLKDDPNPNVVSYVVDEEAGWTTALHPGKGLLLGYVWKTSEYPWFNAWRHVEQGRPAARGLEFGTTGLHQPYPILARKGTIFGRPLFAFADAGESHTRSYTMFLVEAKPGLAGVSAVEARGKTFVVKGRSGEELAVR
ncbi:MAG: hypothetical protein JNN08_23325 [Bryobacterales bacterium]|nr:hypothetical protein [Bryobacterales bacterium]